MNDAADAFIMRLSETGYIEWYNQIFSGFSTINDYIFSVAINSPSGGLTGFVYSIYYLYPNAYGILKLSYSEGKLIFFKTIDSPVRADAGVAPLFF